MYVQNTELLLAPVHIDLNGEASQNKTLQNCSMICRHTLNLVVYEENVH